ncbi:hypothetical protein DAEQUDRAFT_496830 [Daedalea quercina L-15889]|uniref:Uncharacterized protein n=1 Tax=Daedalea quercina L-15889 TaxID=1314783 RepID=A0A165ML37_9APHY|nr:hypothetical protein DAEQUDRAFT_496830 [Daedalea quercina L-15889]
MHAPAGEGALGGASASTANNSAQPVGLALICEFTLGPQNSVWAPPRSLDGPQAVRRRRRPGAIWRSQGGRAVLAAWPRTQLIGHRVGVGEAGRALPPGPTPVDRCGVTAQPAAKATVASDAVVAAAFIAAAAGPRPCTVPYGVPTVPHRCSAVLPIAPSTPCALRPRCVLRDSRARGAAYVGERDLTTRGTRLQDAYVLACAPYTVGVRTWLRVRSGAAEGQACGGDDEIGKPL